MVSESLFRKQCKHMAFGSHASESHVKTHGLKACSENHVKHMVVGSPVSENHVQHMVFESLFRKQAKTHGFESRLETM